MAYWQEHSLGVAPQVSGFGTAATVDADFAWIQGDRPKVQFATELVELDLMTGEIGAAPERLPGRRHGTISFSMPLEGLKSGYDPTADDPGDTGILPHWVCMVANALGSNIAASDTAVKFWKGLHLSLSEYTAGVAVTSGVIAGCTSTLVKTFDATTSNKVSVGELVIAATTATDTAPQMGFVKTKAGQDLTLFEASGNVAAAEDDMYGTGTAWISVNHGSQLPMTFRWNGDAEEACYILSDAVCTGFKLTWESGAVPTIEMAYSFHDFQIDKAGTGTKGGLQVPDPFQRIPQIVGVNNGRAMLGAALKCGLESCSIEYKTEIAELKYHSATQGITGVVYKKPRINVSVSLPWVSTDLVYDAAGSSGNVGSHVWQSYLERGVATSLGVYVGSNVGRCFAFLVPSARIVAVPQVAEINGAVGYQLSIEAGAYTADASDTAETSANSPKNSPFRVSVG